VGAVILTSPAGPDGLPNRLVLAACRVAEVDRVFALGGAQAIAALAFGTESVPKVDKIFGPGNIFVILAKRRVFGLVGIDGLPGPTETVVVADDSADPAYCAADLLAQAEHDPLASAILLTDSPALAAAVAAEVDRQLGTLSRAEVIRQSLDRSGGIGVVERLEQAVELANEYAPEHVSLLVRDPWTWIPRIRHAGGVFVGRHSTHVIGDYVAGPSHVMPTGGTAKFASPVNLEDFQKVISLIALDDAHFAALAPDAIRIAELEGFTAHAAAMRVRLERD
ncbi:MAG TPA: histidinol dehydrogenase, partial [Dehalococcoidia bacterium]|nr:histidinol dehydrogenase [Dehalococcoidia bacterium]